MIIGVPRERKTLEKRIAIIPDGVKELTKHGHKVIIETNAGQGSFYSDEDLENAGAEIVPSLKDVWTKADMVVKVKEPHEEEYQYFREGLLLFDYLHLAGLPDVTKELLKSKVDSVAYELVQTPDGRLPLLEPMSEIAGKLSVLNGSYALLAQNAGRGVLLGGCIGVAPAKVVIVGAGKAGKAAAEVALGMGADVTVFDINYNQLEKVHEIYHGKVKTMHSSHTSLMRATKEADLVIGAVLVPGAKAPNVITRDIVKNMPEGSVIVDISIDQGGCVETIKTTSLKEPTFVEEGVVHYGVPNMPAQTARTSTQALTAATLPYVVALADNGLKEAVKKYPAMRPAVSTYQGKLITKAVGEALGIETAEF